MVWEGRTKQRNCCQPFVDGTLQIGSGVQEVLPLSLSTVPQSHPRPSGTMAGRSASHPWKEVLINHLHQLNHLSVPTPADSWGFPYEMQP